MDRRVFSRLVMAGFIRIISISLSAVVECMLIGRFLGAEGLSAANIASPIFSLMTLFSDILGTGMSVSVSKDLTRGNRERAADTVNTVFTVTILVSALGMIAGLFFPGLVTLLLGGSDMSPGIFSGATEYIGTLLTFSIPYLLYDVLGDLAMLEGADAHLKWASAVQLTADLVGVSIAVKLNTGLRGISTAIGIAYLLACLVVASFFLGKRSMFRPRLRMPDLSHLKDVVMMGLPMIVKGLCGIVWPSAVNRLMLRYGTVNGMAALSIQNAIHYVPNALCSSIAGAALIMSGMYSGERDHDGLRKLNTFILNWSVFGGLLTSLPLAVAAKPLMKLFTDDPEVISLGVTALLMFLPGVPFLALNYSASSYLQGIGNNLASSVVIFINHIILSVSSAAILARIWGIKGIYASYGFCEILMTLLIIINIIVFLNRNRKLEKAEESKDIEYRKSIGSLEDAVAVSEDVYGLCIKAGISAADAYHISLCSEELAANSIEHGFNDGKKHDLELRVLINEEDLYLRLRDDCRRFDLTERYKIINPEDKTKNIGLRIVFANADDVSYSSALNMNNVCFRYSLKKD